jgi:hypothetical protein
VKTFEWHCKPLRRRFFSLDHKHLTRRPTCLFGVHLRPRAHKYLTKIVPIEPAAVEVPVSGTIAGVPVRGIADIVTTDGMAVDVKTASRKPSGLAADHALQLATYTELLAGTSGETRVDTLVGTKDPQLVQIDPHAGRSRTAAGGADLPAGRRGHRRRFVSAEPRLERVQPAVLRVCRCVRAGIRGKRARMKVYPAEINGWAR